MLRLHTGTSAYGVKNYFRQSDYYASESVGSWGGDLAEELGLRGRVQMDDFDKMADNVNPATGKRLTLRTNKFRRIGEDMIFSLPKDVGAFIMLQPPEMRDALLAMVERRVYQVMGMIEADVQTRVRKDGAFENRPGDGLAYAGFMHTTSRLAYGWTIPDPHPHWHMFAFNATKDGEEGGRIKAADFANIYRDRPYYEAVFFSLVADDFQRLGRATERRAGGKWGLAELDSLNRTFSKRTDFIEEEAERLNITDPAVKSTLGGKTRRGKDECRLSPEKLHDGWLEQLTDEQRDALARAAAGLTMGSPAVTAAEAVDYAIRHCSEMLSVIPERELKRVALIHGLGSVTPEEIDREMLDPRHGLVVDTIDGRRMVTTEALRTEERAMARYAASGIGSVAPVGLAEGLTAELENGKNLNDEQFGAVTGLLTSPNRVNLVKGPAGAGKSSLLKKYDEGVRRAGQQVTYLGSTAAAADVLQKDGFDAHTVAHFLLSDKMQQAARGGRVVVDETSIMGHKEALKLLMAGHKHNLKFVFVGDPMQHGSVGRGAFMRLLEQQGTVRPIRLTQILRQTDAAYRAAAQLLSEGKTDEGFDALARLGWVAELPDAERHAAMAADYVEARQGGMAWNDVLCVAPTHAEANAVTAAIRQRLRDDGQLSGEEREFTRLVQVKTTEAERGQALTYRVGDVLQFHQNAQGGFAKGDRLIVTDPAQVPLSEAGKFALYRPEKIGLAEGDVIRFTGTVKTRDGQHTLRNGAARVVAGFTEGGNIRLDNGWVVEKDAGHFRHGFVETSIGSQGRTVRRVLLSMPMAAGLALNMQQLYVSASRARDSVRVYCDDQDAVREAARRDSRQLLALDLKPESSEQKRRAEMQEHLERERRLNLLRKPFRYVTGLVPGRSPTPQPPTPRHAARVQAGRERHQGPRL